MLDDLGLDGDVQAGGGLVGDEQGGIARQRHRDHHPLDHASRYLVGVTCEALPRMGNPEQVEHLQCECLRFPDGLALMDPDPLHQLGADGEDRIERRHGLLEDHRHVVAPDAAHGTGRQRHEVATPAVLAGEPDVALHSGRFLVVEQPHEGEADGGFSRAGFTDQGHDLSRCDREAHVPHRVHDSLAAVKPHVETADLKDGIGGGHRPLVRDVGRSMTQGQGDAWSPCCPFTVVWARFGPMDSRSRFIRPSTQSDRTRRS